MKYKVGDKVRIVSERVECGWTVWPEAKDQWQGETMTISKVWENSYDMAEDNGKWTWTDDMITGLAEDDISKENTDSAGYISEKNYEVRENRMSEVAKMLGVDLDDEFEVCGLGRHRYKITKNGLHDTLGQEYYSLLADLLVGRREIGKWKPATGDEYYCINEFGEVEFDYWHGDIYDLAFATLGNCFKTAEKAKSEKNMVKEKLGITEWKENE